MLVLIFLYDVTVWSVTMVTHSLATYFNKYWKTHIYQGEFENKPQNCFLYMKKIIFHDNILKYLSGISIKMYAMGTGNNIQLIVTQIHQNLIGLILFMVTMATII